MEIPELSSASAAVQPNVSILALLSSDHHLSQLQDALDSKCYTLHYTNTAEDFIRTLNGGQSVDCLLIEAKVAIESLFAALRQDNILLPVVILSSSLSTSQETTHEWYHQAEVNINSAELSAVGDRINAAIKQFLQLSPKETSFTFQPDRSLENTPLSPAVLLEQQQRLASKLKERLGYLGVYYKRNASNFYRNLSPQDQQQLLKELTSKYQAILLAYFSETQELNTLIDEFTNLSFFTDISVTQIVEIHMKLIDDYSKQLKLEGRNEAVLINYRLTLLDIISHLCEMYRRSIPREP